MFQASPLPLWHFVARSLAPPLQASASDLAGVVNFELPESDLLELQQAPTTVAESPQPRLYPIDMLDTEYAEMLRQRAEAEEQARLDPLTLCVDILEGLRNQRDDGLENGIDGTVEQRVSDILARTAIELVSDTPELFELVDWAQLAVLTNALESDELLSYCDLFEPTQITAIDECVQSRCGTPLTEFSRAVLDRAYDPTTGVPLGMDPEHYDPTWLFPSPETERLYEANGLTAEQAAEAARIQRIVDLRERSESDWQYLHDQASFLIEWPDQQIRD